MKPWVIQLILGILYTICIVNITQYITKIVVTNKVMKQTAQMFRQTLLNYLGYECLEMIPPANIHLALVYAYTALPLCATNKKHILKAIEISTLTQDEKDYLTKYLTADQFEATPLAKQYEILIKQFEFINSISRKSESSCERKEDSM